MMDKTEESIERGTKGLEREVCAWTLDVGLLLIRVGVGLVFIVHGWPKIVGGVEKWTALGQAMGALGIAFAPALWGFLAAVAEFVGGIMLSLGLFHRLFAFMLAFTMMVATVMLIQSGKSFSGWAYAVTMLAVFVGLIFTGSGKFSLRETVPGLRRKWWA
jgi:putative oxidoreductase